MDGPLLPIPHGPGRGGDLSKIEGVTAQIIGRNASKVLCTNEELKTHMLSPKMKCKSGEKPPTDISPIRRELFKGNGSQSFGLIF